MVHQEGVGRRSLRLQRVAALAITTVAITLGGAGQALADYSSTVLADNPLAYFRLDETGNNPFMYNYAGTGSGVHEVNPVQGLPGALVNEDPNLAVAYTDQDLDRSRFGLGDVTDEFSIEFWVFTTMPLLPANVDQWYEGSGLVDGEKTGVTSDYGTALIRNGHVGLGVGNPDTTIESTTDVTDNQWHHVVATFDVAGSSQGSMRLYVDGDLEAAESVNGPVGTRTTQNMSIGALDTNNNHFSGGIDEVAVYAKTLTAGDVAEHYDAGAAPEVTVLVRDYLFGGEGTVVSPEFGIDCGPITDACDTIVPLGTEIEFTAVAAAGSRFSGWDDDSGCEPLTAPTCSFVADNPGFNNIMVLGSNFYFTGRTLAEGLVDSTGASAARIEDALDNSIQPANESGINLSNVALSGLPALDFGQSGGALAVLVPLNQVRLIGSDGATLVGSDGGTFSTRAPNPAGLIGSDGGTLLGSDGGSLIGSDGGTLLGSDGGTRREAGAACPGAFSRTGRLFVLGRYKKELTAPGTTRASFKLTQIGKDIIETYAHMNLELKARRKPLEAMPATYLQAIQPADEGRTGVVYDALCVTK